MSYKIINFNQTNGIITVKFDDNITTVNLLLPLDEEGKAPEGEALDKFILQFEPLPLPEVTVSNAEVISSLVQPETTATTTVIDLNTEKYTAYGELSNAVIGIKRLFISLIPNQDFSYLVKAEQAQQFKNANYIGDVPSYIAAEIVLTGATAKACTDNIIAKFDKWTLEIDPKIEAIRSVYGSKILAASNSNELSNIKSDYNAKLSGIALTYKDAYSSLANFGASNT